MPKAWIDNRITYGIAKGAAVQEIMYKPDGNKGFIKHYGLEVFNWRKMLHGILTRELKEQYRAWENETWMDIWSMTKQN